MIDYSAAGEFAEAVQAFAMIESGESERATGDGGRAFGLLQMHPATFARFYTAPRSAASPRFGPDVSDTWSEAQIKACARFLEIHDFLRASEEARDLVIQAWNLGEHAVFYQMKRNPTYLRRWKEAYAKL
ncbi:MAG: hypothetical protein JO189_15730 [Deltaproteobacteria bacterium]|nr:hypothetical protein [Deltaproteobacteria bacterium]